MKLVYKIFVSVLVICIPFISVFAACNIVLRMPDLYVYEFNSTEVTNQIELSMKDDELGKFFSDFMIGKTKDFQLVAEFQEREQNVFSKNDQNNMENLRNILNRMLIIMGILLAVTVITYWILIAKKKRTEIRYAFKGSLIIFVILTILIVITFNIQYARDFINQVIFISSMEANEVLPLMLTEQFTRDCIVASIAVASVIIAILASITWRLTKPRRMFW